MMIGYERKTASGKAEGRELRAEAMYIRLSGEEKGIESLNDFYRSLAEAFLVHCTERLLPRLAEGRYTARLICTAEEKENLLFVHTEYLLCRRGRRLAVEEENLCWQMPEGHLVGNRKALVEVPKEKLTNLRILPKNGKRLAR